MASPQPSDFCLDCHWDGFDDISMLPSDQWHCDDAHHTEDAVCNVDESCCKSDACSLNCSSVCDGFVDCDISSTVCSDANCDEVNCNEASCGESHCESTGPACFDKHCFSESQNLDNVAANLLHETNIQWDTSMFLPSMVEHQADVPAVDSHLTDPHAATPYHTGNVFANSHCHGSTHAPVISCQQYLKDSSNLWCHDPAYTNQTDMCHVDTNNVLSDMPPYPNELNSMLFNQQYDAAKMPCFQGDGAPSCSDTGFQHLGCYLRNSGDTRLLEFSKAQSQSRVHRHYHGQAHHRVSHYSRHHNSRKSLSSQTISSLIDTPPSLDRAMSSALTSPTPGIVTEEGTSHVCRWNHGASVCNVTFASAGELQQHLLTEHMKPINGNKGHGYYCCWEGCHRPDEPFSQKSKLQGHFLTHSNYKNFSCSVCRKAFARQATLERHERSHRGEKPFKCNECGKAFTDSSELKTHSRTHTGEKPFKCTFPGCDFQTGDSSNMSSHKLTHNGRRHKCTYPGCTKSFTRPDQLKRHLKTTHKLDNTSLPMSPTFQVPLLPIGAVN